MSLIYIILLVSYNLMFYEYIVLLVSYSYNKNAGLFMALQPRIIACGTKRATMGMVIRFICGPILMSAASILIGLKEVKLHAAIVQVRTYVYTS